MFLLVVNEAVKVSGFFSGVAAVLLLLQYDV
jgi:hypothetical protein